MLIEIVLGVSHRLLRQSDWARQRLAEHGGKQVRVELPLARLFLRIAADGYIEHGETDAAPDLVIELTPVAAAKWLSDREAGWREARVDGDMDLAAAISHVMANLRWEFEEDLSQVVGDVAAHRIGQSLRRLSGWPGDAGQSLAVGIAEYLTEERHLLATPLRAEEFTKEVDELRDAVERLEKRLGKLEQRVVESSPH